MSMDEVIQKLKDKTAEVPKEELEKMLDDKKKDREEKAQKASEQKARGLQKRYSCIHCTGWQEGKCQNMESPMFGNHMNADEVCRMCNEIVTRETTGYFR